MYYLKVTAKQKWGALNETCIHEHNWLVQPWGMHNNFDFDNKSSKQVLRDVFWCNIIIHTPAYIWRPTLCIWMQFCTITFVINKKPVDGYVVPHQLHQHKTAALSPITCGPNYAVFSFTPAYTQHLALSGSRQNYQPCLKHMKRHCNTQYM